MANFLLLHLGRPERAVAEFARVLRAGRAGRARRSGTCPSGRASSACSSTHSPRPARRRRRSSRVGPPFFRFADEEEFARLLSGQGLQDVEVQTVAFPHHEADR